MVVPFALIADVRAPDRLRRLTFAAAALIVTALGPIGLQYAWSGPGVFHFLTYQGERGIQIESIFASIMAAGHAAGVPMAEAATHGGFDVTGPLASPLKLVSTLAVVTFQGSLMLFMTRRRKPDSADALRFGCLVPMDPEVALPPSPAGFIVLGLRNVALLSLVAWGAWRVRPATAS